MPATRRSNGLGGVVPSNVQVPLGSATTNSYPPVPNEYG